MAVKLDPAQRKAVNHVDGPFLCIAGPGSGKTTVIIHRVAHLVKHGVDPQRILVMTFAKNAAKELDERYSRLKGAKPGVEFSTIHAFAYKIVRYNREFMNYTIIDSRQQKACFKALLRDLKIELSSYRDMDNIYKEIALDISHYRELSPKGKQSFTPNLFKDLDEFLKYYEGYKKYKQKNLFLDFDDLLYFCRNLLYQKPEVLDFFRSQYDYIMVDEFQDTSEVQANIVYMVAAPKNNLFICGDDDQSIYGFRNAKPQIMISFEDTFHGCGISRLTTNYRSDKKIVEAAGNLISHNTVRFQKDISGASSGEGIIQVVHCMDEGAERALIPTYILNEQGANVPFYEMAILTRTKREALNLCKPLTDNNIPFYCDLGLLNPHKGPVFKTMINYLMIAYNDPDVDWDNIRAIINCPSRYISNSLMERADNLSDLLSLIKKEAPRKARAVRELIGLINLIRKKAKNAATIRETMEYIWNEADLDQWVKDNCHYYYQDEDEYYDSRNQLLAEMGCTASMKEYKSIVETENRIFEQALAANARNKDRGVTIMTMHAAKGKEWDCVYIPSCNQGNIPYIRKDEILTKERMEEERRLMYVAMTRARNKCTLIIGGKEPTSRFLNEALGQGSKDRMEETA